MELKIESKEGAYARLNISLKNGWKAELSVSGDPKNGTHVYIQLFKTENNTDLGFWERLKLKS
jgi:hypothetical protein